MKHCDLVVAPTNISIILQEHQAASPFQGISITDNRLLEGKTLGPKVHRFGSETPWNDQFFGNCEL